MSLTNASAQRTDVPGSPMPRAVDIARLAGLRPDQVEVVARIDSTNQALLQRPWPPEPAEPCALVALHQTAGRGRRGRVWLSGPMHSLAVSVATEWSLPQGASRLEGLSVRTGVCLAERLSERVPDLSLKWPNDLQRGGRKVAGLLLESRLQADRVRVVAGLGVNLLTDPSVQASVDQPVGALFDDADALPSRESLLATIIGAMLGAFAESQRPAERPLPARWARFDALRGAEVAVSFDGHTLHTGEVLGVDHDGALRLMEAGGERRITSGEVSVRRVRPTTDRGPT